jgi:hypothetical protein
VPRTGATFGLDWLGRLAAAPLGETAEGYVGIPILLVAVGLAVFGWRSAITRFLTVMLVVTFVAALGPAVYVEGKVFARLPWARLWMLPILRSAFPSRVMVFAFLILAVMTALWMAGPRRWHWARWPLAALAVAAIVADIPPFASAPGSDVPKFISAGWYRHQLRPGETVAVISTVGNAGMLWQAASNFYFRLAGGYINAVITPRTDLPQAVQNLNFATPLYVEQFRAFIKRADVGAILVQADAPPRWIGILSKLGLNGQLVGGVLLYRTNDCRTCHLVLLGDDHDHRGARPHVRPITSIRVLRQGPGSVQVSSASRDTGVGAST